MRCFIKATAKDLRFHSKEILDTVSRGEEVIITFRGKPQAKLVPFNSAEDKNQKSTSLFGIWRDNDEATNVHEYVREIRKERIQ